MPLRKLKISKMLKNKFNYIKNIQKAAFVETIDDQCSLNLDEKRCESVSTQTNDIGSSSILGDIHKQFNLDTVADYTAY